LTAEQNWQSLNESLKVGDTLERTVALQAVDVSGMAFTPLVYKAIPSVGIYPVQPTVEDSSNRGTLNGLRTETVTYVFEQAGKILIPDIELSWWNLSENKLEKIELPGRVINIAAGVESVSSTVVLPAKQLQKHYLLPVIFVLLLIVSVLYYFRKELVRHWITQREARMESEERYFQRVEKLIRSKNSKAALRSIMRWLDRINDTSSPAQLDGFINHYSDAQAKKVIDQFLRSVAASEKLADPTPLLEVLSTARKNWQQAREQRGPGVNVLPALNPE